MSSAHLFLVTFAVTVKLPAWGWLCEAYRNTVFIWEEVNVTKATSHCCHLPLTHPPSPGPNSSTSNVSQLQPGWLTPWRNKPLLCHLFHVSRSWLNPCVRFHSIPISKPYQLLRGTFATDDRNRYGSFSTWDLSRTSTHGWSHVCALVYTLPLLKLPLLLKYRERTQHYHSCRRHIECFIFLSFYIIIQAHTKVISQELLCPVHCQSDYI